MAKILFRLRQVPDEEADDVRQLLDDNGIDWFETSAGKFQISFPAIWLSDESQEEHAKSVLQQYQSARAQRLRAEHADQVARGEVETLSKRILTRPLPFLLAMLAIIFILYISIKPFFSILF